MAVPLRIEQVLTFGVEEEFVLADASSRITVPRAPEVLEKMTRQLGPRAQQEFYATQVEICSEPHLSAAKLRADLAGARRVAADAAADASCLLVASGAAVLTPGSLAVMDEPRYHRMATRFASLVESSDSELSGCHVHVGTVDPSEALAVSAGLRPWLPVVQALAANSPFSAGRDRGCASWRGVDYRRWPTVGPAPALDQAGYEATVAGLVASGTILDRKMLLWYARPSDRWPTLEMRVTDVNADLDVTMLIAVLLRALATTVLAEVRAGLKQERIADAQLADAHDQAARHGMDAFAANPAGERVPMTTRLAELIERALPGLRAAGDVELAYELMDAVYAHRTGAERQRAWFAARSSLADVVDNLARTAVTP
ncbi:carboxylate-amine ligase [Catenulispora sp. GAS73]|uniref:carboxylate-amine ligase n=1 Tax=Catenulispora sp. GAS73 TaxID=3156269 RepID=UPI0035147F3C